MSRCNSFPPRRLVRLAGAGLMAALLGACAGSVRDGGAGSLAADGHATLTVLATSDLHGHVLGYDYYRLHEDPEIGLERLAGLISAARERDPHSLLVDAGDTIQGSALADWQARVQPPACDRRLAIYEAMTALGYDAATVGNHEFNYGLPFLRQVTGLPFDDSGRRCRGPGFPIVVSNLHDADSGQPLYAPRWLLQRTLPVRGLDGAVVPRALRIGVIGLVPPKILDWDRAHLDGRVRVDGMLESARQQVAALRGEGADVVVALVHGGLDPRPYAPEMENAAWHLAADGGIDAMVMAHQHQRFPDPGSERPAFAQVPALDHQRGLVHGVPAVMASYWGKGLGVIELALQYRQGRWQVQRQASRSQVLDGTVEAAGGPEGASLRDLVRAEHEATIAHVSQPLTRSDFDLASHFADVGDVSALQVVNLAQAQFITDHVRQHLPRYRHLPVLSAVAPFRTGFAGPEDYTLVPAGDVAMRHAADLYLYPNTLVAVRVDGAGLKAWLEQSALRFNQVDPQRPGRQELVDPRVAGYHFDVIHGINYVIDISRPPGERIVELRFNGADVDAGQQFIVATNNYRTGSGAAFGLGPEQVIVDTRLESRQVLADWLRRQPALERARHGADLPWRFAPLALAGELVFTTGTGQPPPERLPAGHRLHRLGEAGPGRVQYALEIAPH